jgi:hypothetical protein
MDLSSLIQIISSLAMTLGIVFGILNLKNFQASRKREAAILMLNSFQTMEFVRGLLYIFDLPDNAANEDLESLPEEKFMTIYLVLGTWERLGILVHRNEIPIDLVDDAFSGPIIQSWVKLGGYVAAFRARMQRETGFEWFQWLAERMLEREQHGSAVPAYVAHRDWKAG